LKALCGKGCEARFHLPCRNRQINIAECRVLDRAMRYLSAPCLFKTAAGMETGAPILINNTREAC
jgi:hypothetical protein